MERGKLRGIVISEKTVSTGCKKKSLSVLF